MVQSTDNNASSREAREGQGNKVQERDKSPLHHRAANGTDSSLDSPAFWACVEPVPPEVSSISVNDAIYPASLEISNQDGTVEDMAASENFWDQFIVSTPPPDSSSSAHIVELYEDIEQPSMRPTDANVDSIYPENGQASPHALNVSTTSISSEPTRQSEEWDKLPEFDYAALSDGSNVLVEPSKPSTSPNRKGSSSKSRSPHSRSHSGSPQPGARSPIKKTNNGSSKKRRGYLAHELQKVNAVRQEGACLRCQILKEPCGEGCPCPRCLDVNATATIWRAPCFKGRITNVKVYRDRCMSYPEGMRSIDKWVTPRKLKIKLYHNGFDGVNHDPSTRPQIEIIVQNFVSVPTDVLHKQWIRNGEVIRHEMPAYAIPPKQKKRATKAIEVCFAQHWDTVVDSFSAHLEPLVAEAFIEGKRLHERLPLIHDALSIYGITCLISKSFNLAGTETLGIRPVDDPVSPYYGRIPIPMYLDTQLDEMWEGVMGKISKKLLSELKRKILGRKKEHWYEVCLCLIILLANLETVYGAWLGQKGRYYKGVSPD